VQTRGLAWFCENQTAGILKSKVCLLLPLFWVPHRILRNDFTVFPKGEIAFYVVIWSSPRSSTNLSSYS
jgi:hypothetical protein